MSKRVYVRDMADQILDKSRAGEFLYCPNCGTQYSANAGDYWNVPDDHAFKCECGEYMVLARKREQIIGIFD